MHPVVGKAAAACGWTGVAGHWLRRRHFSAATLDRLAETIQASESRHSGELVLVVESHLPRDVQDAGVRALEVFGRQLVWDTAARTGVLLYVALGDHCIELIADRGVTVEQSVWDDICATLKQRFCAGDYRGGLDEAIVSIEHALTQCLQPDAHDAPNRLADRPVLL